MQQEGAYKKSLQLCLHGRMWCCLLQRRVMFCGSAICQWATFQHCTASMNLHAIAPNGGRTRMRTMNQKCMSIYWNLRCMWQPMLAYTSVVAVFAGKTFIVL